MIDPLKIVFEQEVKNQKKEILISEILDFLTGENSYNLSLGECNFLDSLVHRYHSIGEFRLSKKQLDWLLRIAYKCGFNSGDVDFWKDMRKQYFLNRRKK